MFQVLSQQQFTPQQLQQAQQAVAAQQQVQQQQQQQFTMTSQQQAVAQVQHQNLLQQATGLNPQFPQANQLLFNQQQHQQLLQQQHQAQILQQQLQQIKPPIVPQAQKPTVQRKTKSLMPLSQLNSDRPILIETETPPPSTPLTPNPSPASPDSISPLYAPIDLDAQTESNHDTALTLACAGGHSELVTLLLSKGADIEHRDKKGMHIYIY